MKEVLALCAGASAFAWGACLGGWFWGARCAARRRSAMRDAMGATSALAACSVQLECNGISAWVLGQAVRGSLGHPKLPRSVVLLFGHGFDPDAALVRRAGLGGVLTVEACALTRMRLVIAGALGGCLAGSLLSAELAVIFMAVGGGAGWTALARALRAEAEERSFVAERQFSQMVEVVVLGIKSGMSFDRALRLYCDRFEGSLSRSLFLAQNQWRHGLAERSEGLRAVADSYDSPLFGRFAENVVRSLRFGTSLATGLNALALEARVTRKAKLEEKVAKAPVKMLLPVGTLILPAMLILILGPIVLDLMQGF